MELKELDHAAVEAAGVLKNLSHPTRLRILCALADGDKTVSEIMKACDLEQAPTSQFLKTLKSDRLIESRADGQSRIYSISDKRILVLIKALQRIFCE